MDSAKHAAIGFGCSAVALTATFPLETLARQFHVTDRSSVTSATLIRGMMSRGVSGFYRGLTPALATQPLYWGCYMPIYQALKNVEVPIGSSWHHSMAAAWTAGAISTIVTNPLWMVRQRMQTEIIKGKRNSYGALVGEMWREAGLKTFFRGTGLTLVKNVQMAFLMPLFDHWTNQAKNNQGWSAQLTPYIGAGATLAVTAAAAKIISSTGVYPLDVIRTNVRFQEGQKVRLLDVTKELVKRKGGPLNLFRGIHWYWLSSAGMFAVMMSLKNLFE